MDRALSKTYIKQQLQRKIIWGITLVGLLLLIFYGLRHSLATSIVASKLRTAKAEMGNIENTINATGEVIPEFEQIITSPIRAEIKQVFLSVGTAINVNQAILELNKEFAILKQEKLKDQLALKENSITQLKLQLDKRLADLKINNQIKGLRINALKADLADAEKLTAIGGGTEASIEKIKLDLEIAQLEKQQLENDLHYNQQSVASDLKELELQVAIQSKELREFTRKLEQAEVNATRQGVLTWVNENIGTTVTEGEMLAKIADLASFRIEGAISDIYSDKVSLGQTVITRINDTDLRGLITNIKPTVEDGIIQFTIQLNEQNHELLRPNLKVEVFLITKSSTNSIRVANGPTFNGRKQQFIYVKEGNIARRRQVRIGLSNVDYVEVLDNLKVGEEVLLTDMSDYEELEEVRIGEQ